jgi:hypothetical protein
MAEIDFHPSSTMADLFPDDGTDDVLLIDFHDGIILD